MTRPAPVYRHGLYLLTRRVVWRLFLLLPDPIAAQIFRYVVGITLLSFKGDEQLEVHAAVLMSNHLHVVAYDPEAERTNFLNRLYAQLARAINRHRGRKGRLFDLPSPRDKSQIMDPEGLVRAIVYRRYALFDNRGGIEELARNPMRSKGLRSGREDGFKPIALQASLPTGRSRLTRSVLRAHVLPRDTSCERQHRRDMSAPGEGVPTSAGGRGSARPC